MTRHLVDDLGRPVAVPDVVRRVVSLVPSLTESVAASTVGSVPDVLVGVTDWCTHPADLSSRDVARVRGTKNPDLAAIVALEPDLVLANVEENRKPDVETLAGQGIAVWVTDVRSLDGPPEAHPALGPDGALSRMLNACGLESRPAWLRDAERAWRDAGAAAVGRARRRVVVPVWRRPWMAVGPDTFTGAVLERLGYDNVLGRSATDAGGPQRYPRFAPETLPPHDLVVLPDEPYVFTADDGPEAFPGTPSALVPGRLLTWYGPSLAEAARVLPGLLGRALPTMR